MGSELDIWVLMWEISLSDIFMDFGGEKNLLVYVYDILGFYFDFEVWIDVCFGLQVICEGWIQ